jgi:hypothetical protein
MSKVGFSIWKKLMNNLIHLFLFFANNANAGGYRITCKDGMEFSYTGESSNYSPYDLCQDHGGLRANKSNNATSQKSHNDDSKKNKSKSKDNAIMFGVSAWITPYALKTIYNAEVYSMKDGSIYKISKSYKRFYSAGITLQSRYAYIDCGLTTYAGNTGFYPNYFGNGFVEYVATSPPDDGVYKNTSVFDTAVYGGTYSFGLSLPLVFKKNKKMALFAGISYEHSFYGAYESGDGLMDFNSDALGTSVGMRSTFGKFFAEVVSADTFESFDFVPSQIYSEYDPGITFKIGVSLK